MTTNSQAEAVPPLLALQEVTVLPTRSGAAPVLEQINWQVRSREFWLIGSPPGTGKSALLQTAAGIHRPGGGEVRLFGEALDALDEEELLQIRQRVGLVFEGGGHLFHQMTVAENVALPYCYHHDCPLTGALEALEKVLGLCELSDYAGHLPSRTPRALAPRIGLARALIGAPDLLLLDNPLHGLDARQREWWRTALARLVREGCGGAPLTLVVAADDPRPWLDLAGRFALIQDRRLVVLKNRAAFDSASTAGGQDLLAPGGGGG